jgi:hypothetical protein
VALHQVRGTPGRGPRFQCFLLVWIIVAARFLFSESDQALDGLIAHSSLERQDVAGAHRRGGIDRTLPGHGSRTGYRPIWSLLGRLDSLSSGVRLLLFLSRLLLGRHGFADLLESKA